MKTRKRESGLRQMQDVRMKPQKTVERTPAREMRKLNRTYIRR